MIMINLPLPPKKLNPNVTGHWTSKNKDKVNAKSCGFNCAKNIKHDLTKDDKLSQLMEVYYPNNKRLDIDNFLSSCKSMLDGVYEALGLDDRQVFESTVKYMSPIKDWAGIKLYIDKHDDAIESLDIRWLKHQGCIVTLGGRFTTPWSSENIQKFLDTIKEDTIK
jgi:Holliday junction resolvase RusA-like endonuclease